MTTYLGIGELLFWELRGQVFQCPARTDKCRNLVPARNIVESDENHI